MTYGKRLSYLIVIDSIIVAFAIFISTFLLNYYDFLTSKPIVASSIVLLLGHHFFSYYYNLYKRAWQYASIGELVVIFKVVTFSVILAALAQFILLQDIFFRALSITWMLHMLLIGGSRFAWRMFRDTYMNTKNKKKRVLVIGAGSAGMMIVRQLRQSADSDLNPIGFIDDDIRKQNLEIMGVPVLGPTVDIVDQVRQLEIDTIVIAIPSLSKNEMKRIYEECSKTEAKTQIIPMIEDLMTGKVSINSFRDVKVEDLLGREPIKLDTDNIAETLTGKTVLVTGAGGSIGSEICRQVSKFNPDQVVLLGHGENSIYTIEMELKNTYGDAITFIPVIADVQDRERLGEVMNLHRPNVVYHAAAHKHVPLMEANPHESVKNNVIGTKNVAEAASDADVETFVMVSTDKAVNPTSVMGATKRLAEMIVQQMDKISATRFVAVRFGNVLGSRGSVIPLFKKQIQKGGPVTVTHPDMVRYFMTIPEASRLVIQAGAMARGGEIFVLDMGEPVKIVDLAENLIKLSGYSVDEIGIKFAGVRPGEKLYEELLGKDEVHDEQIYPKIYVGKSINADLSVVMDFVGRFEGMDKLGVRERALDIAHNRINSEKELVYVK
ncbi:nucleoside-diphosphate sugar epimerase/dehydratase [Alkalihalobacillus macyae]|uniref:polysaccharide biosynthesis protein n=1 Tax=Guptibacillus hwajinpoensis TaxID=208199 RepID=UPI00273AA6C6|nr:nucleoside-diphosphate sugar epimerase/dehydratase [Alkalihalobacillus macyae]MDP4551657.1 nucleoside-diphosphate sugar epimerase/dehydratase [Alkalihalobacillus macyae]